MIMRWVDDGEAGAARWVDGGERGICKVGRPEDEKRGL